MPKQLQKIRSELPNGDPTLMNRVAWVRRWADRNASVEYALSAQKKAIAGTGKRSRAEQGLALRTLAWQACFRGNFDEAMSNCLSAETFLPESEHVEARATIYCILGAIHFSRNRLDLANCAIDRGFWLLRDVPEADVSHIMTDLLLRRSTIQRYSGEKARASITLGRAREICMGEMENLVDFITAAWFIADGEADAAQDRAIEGMVSATALGNRMILPYLHNVLGACDAKLGRADAAIKNFKLGLEIAESDGDNIVRCFLLRGYAQMENDCGNADEAIRLLRLAAVAAKLKGFAFEQKRVALDLADTFENLGKYKLAVDQHKLAWRLQSETRVR